MIDNPTIRQEAFEELRDAGALVTVLWEVPGAYDPAEGAPGPGVAHAYVTYGLVFEYNFKEVGVQVDSLIQAGDRQLLLAALDPAGAVVPVPPYGALVALADGTCATVKKARPLSPAGVTLMHDITIKAP